LVILSSPTLSTTASGATIEGVGIGAGSFGASDGETGFGVGGGGGCCPNASVAPSRRKVNLILLE
jgi:hypothetical protein